MKNYKRLTERITASNTGRTVLVIPAFRHKIIQQTNRLAELEDKIESGELCDSKETAREILETLYKQTHNYYPSIDSYCLSRKVILVKDLEAACKKYGVNLEDEE